MSIVNSAEQALLAAGRFVERGAYGLPFKSGEDKYTAAALASGSTIMCWTPPKGFIFRGGRLGTAGLGSNVTLAVGYAASTVDPVGVPAVTNAFLTATACATAGVTTLVPTFATMDFVFDGGTQITITTAGAAATGAIKLIVDGMFTQ